MWASTTQAYFHSNSITFGMVTAEELGSPDGPMVISVPAGILIPLYNIGGMGTLEYYRGGKPEPGKTTKQVGGNPFVISCMMSLVLVVPKIKLPVCVEAMLGNVTPCASPISFLALGGCLNLMSVGGYKKEVLADMGYRLVFRPAMFLRLSYSLEFRGVEFLALMATSAPPTAVTTYNMARNMDVGGELTGRPVVFQSLGSIATIFLWIFLLSGLGVL